MIYGACYCQFDGRLPFSIVAMTYEGNGIWKCPKCGQIEDNHEIVYSMTLKFEKTREGSLSWLDIEIIEQELNECETCSNHAEGVFSCDLLYHPYKMTSPEFGTEYDLDIEIIQEQRKDTRCGNCHRWSRKGSHGTGYCSRWDEQTDARIKGKSCWEASERIQNG